MNSTTPRPYVLECWEIDPDTIEECWRPWSTYVTATNALERRDKLASKGHTARVIDSTTGAVVDGSEQLPDCDLCGEPHAGPFDGSCLL